MKRCLMILMTMPLRSVEKSGNTPRFEHSSLVNFSQTLEVQGLAGWW
jgi:hypothetical protein